MSKNSTKTAPESSEPAQTLTGGQMEAEIVQLKAEVATLRALVVDCVRVARGERPLDKEAFKAV